MNKHLSLEALEEGLQHIQAAPKDQGSVDMIIRRPQENEREVLEVGDFDLLEGLVGDRWKAPMKNGEPALGRQLNIMGTRAIALIAQSEDRWPLAGDQLFIDLDLSYENLPPGTQLKMGEVIIEVTDKLHAGCKKFSARFGEDAHVFVNSAHGKKHNLRGICAKMVQAGNVRVGDLIRKLG